MQAVLPQIRVGFFRTRKPKTLNPKPAPHVDLFDPTRNPELPQKALHELLPLTLFNP